MKHLSIKSGSIIDEVHVPSSKSYANRVLILAALKGQFRISHLPSNSDVIHLVEALKKLNIKISQNNNVLEIESRFLEDEIHNHEIFVGEGGTTARFLAGMLSLSSNQNVLILGEKLKTRPWSEFILFINKYGGKASLIDNKLTIQGPLKLPKTVEMDCTRTTQFATAIQLAYPQTEVIPSNLDSSLSYWEMTKVLIKKLKDHNTFSVPLDWSSATYAMAFAALNHNIYFPGLEFDSYQSDAKFLRILENLGAIDHCSGGIRVRPVTAVKPVDRDVSDCLDAVPSLGFLLAHINGKHVLRNVMNLVHKESDRLNEVIHLLGQFKKKAYLLGSDLIIEGNSSKISSPVDLILPDDHRMVMVAALFLRHHSGGSITPAEAVNKSYPEFWGLFP